VPQGNGGGNLRKLDDHEKGHSEPQRFISTVIYFATLSELYSKLANNDDKRIEKTQIGQIGMPRRIASRRVDVAANGKLAR